MHLRVARQVLREQAAAGARDDLVAVVSHDLRSPMAAIALQASLISLRIRSAVERNQSAAERMGTLLQDLLDLFRIEGGRFQLTIKPQRVAQLIEDACDLLTPLAESKGIRFTCMADPALWVQADSERLLQLISNSVSNALKCTAEHASRSTCGDRPTARQRPGYPAGATAPSVRPLLAGSPGTREGGGTGTLHLPRRCLRPRR